jgi:hypothetical protein
VIFAESYSGRVPLWMLFCHEKESRVPKGEPKGDSVMTINKASMNLKYFSQAGLKILALACQGKYFKIIFSSTSPSFFVDANFDN